MIRLGAHVEEEATHFGVFATTAKKCAVRIGESVTEMESVGDGFFRARVRHARHGTRYTFLVGDRELTDPYARFLPDGVHAPAMVVESKYGWRHAPVVRPLREHVIYELHVGTFTEQGTYAAAEERLGALVRLGVTAIELMPISSFAGRRGWGYDGVAHFAPFAPYGTPDELRRFIDEAHGLGLSVLLDVVYNHFGPSGNYLSAYSPTYFTKDIQTPWGDAPDFTDPVMRAYVLDNAAYWLKDFRFDGLRLDAIHAIVDPSSPHIVAELVAKAPPGRLVIAEDERRDPEIIEGMRLDAIWADTFHHHVRVTLTGERDGYYAKYSPGAKGVADVIVRGSLPAERFVYCIQNHDQIGNRAFGERLAMQVPLEAYRAVSMLLLVLPMTPLLFMGQEWASSSPFLYFTDHDPELGAQVSAGRRREFAGFEAFRDPKVRETIPDPQAEDTFTRSRLDWSEREKSPHSEVLAFYTKLLVLRQNDPVLRDVTRAGLHAEAHGDVVEVVLRADGERRFVVNLSARPVTFDKRGTLLLASGPLPDDDTLPPWTAALFEVA